MKIKIYLKSHKGSNEFIQESCANIEKYVDSIDLTGSKNYAIVDWSEIN